MKDDNQAQILSQEPKNPRGDQCKGGRAFPNGVHTSFKEPIQLPHREENTGKWRLCVDFRQINAKSVKAAYPVTRINYILDQLREARFISSLNLNEGYWQIPLEESSRQYTAFT